MHATQMTIEGTITALMLVVAAIHLIPISGFFGARAPASLYGIDASDSDLQILMRHRGMLFGILGSFFAYAAFERELQPIAFVAAAVSLASFFYLACSASAYGPPIRKIVIGDLVAALCLLGAVGLYAWSP